MDDSRPQPNSFEALLEDRRKKKLFTDVQLQIGDQLFDAHRVVLSLYSPVLRDLLQDSTTKLAPISDEHVYPEIMEGLLSFLYTGSIRLTPDHVHLFWIAARFLKIPDFNSLGCLNLKMERKDFRALFNNHRKNKKFTDVQLKVGDKLFDGHRVILSLYSPVLEAAISDHWSTTTICPISEEHVDVEIMDDLLNFLYIGSVKFTPDNAQPICMAAHFLQIESLFHTSVLYLRQLINRDNVLPLFSFSNTYQQEGLRGDCLKFIKVNYDTVFNSPEIPKLPFKEFKNLIVGLRERFSGKLLLKRTFDCVVRWTEKNPERLNELPVLLESIPLEELPYQFLTETVSAHPLVKESTSSQQTLANAICNARRYPEVAQRQNMVVIGKSQETPTMYCYDSDTGAWERLPDIPSYATSMFAVTVINRQDIALSSFSMRFPNCIAIFDWTLKTWKMLPVMPELSEKLIPFSIIMCNGYLYVAAKPLDGSYWRTQVLCYSFWTKQWKPLSYRGLNEEEEKNFSMIECNHKLYAINSKTGTVRKFDSEKDEWTMMANKANIENSSTKLTIARHQDKIYACGRNSFDVYDPETNVWTELPAPPVNETSLVSMNGLLLAVGGRLQGSRQATDRIYEFEFSTQKWIKFDTLNSEQMSPLAVAGSFY